jgi:ubiquinone/menaquinone biosynthesis C-methylase UbiE
MEPSRQGHRSSLQQTFMSVESFEYIGSELNFFSRARNWKNYWISVLRPYISGDVLEVGAGLGANTAELKNSEVCSVHCLEPDETLATQLRDAMRGQPGITVGIGTISSLSGRLFDTILYIDVLEHIKNDKSELTDAIRLLRPAGRLIVLAPAHQALYGPFDRSIGHYRRYDRGSLRSCSPPSARLEKMVYLDCVGLITSGAEKLILKQSMPKMGQILFWDKYIIPVSQALDPLFGYRLGKSIAAVWVRIE